MGLSQYNCDSILVKCGDGPAKYLTWGGEKLTLLFCVVGHTMECVCGAWELSGSLLLFLLSRQCNGVLYVHGCDGVNIRGFARPYMLVQIHAHAEGRIANGPIKLLDCVYYRYHTPQFGNWSTQLRMFCSSSSNYTLHSPHCNLNFTSNPSHCFCHTNLSHHQQFCHMRCLIIHAPIQWHRKIFGLLSSATQSMW